MNYYMLTSWAIHIANDLIEILVNYLIKKCKNIFVPGEKYVWRPLEKE